MAALVQTSINTKYTSTMGHRVIKLISETYTLQEETTCDGKISAADESFVKYQYMKFMQENTKWYRELSTQQKNIIPPTHNCTSMLRCQYTKESS